MTPKELTPEYALGLWHRVNPGSGMTPSLYVLDFARTIIREFGGSSPEEKREAEREAWDNGYACGYDGSRPEHLPSNRKIEMVRIRNQRYPELRPEPPPVTLSNGTYRRVPDYDDKKRWELLRSDNQWQAINAPLCITREDFAKCEALMRAEEKAK